MTIKYTCPGCGGHRFKIDVDNRATVNFLPDEDYEVEEVEDGACWENDAYASCTSCSWSGQLDEAETP